MHVAHDIAIEPLDRDRPRWLAGADSALGAGVAVAASLLVVAEIAVLLSGVLARYVFRAPLIWTDELAAILFLWLGMLGAVIALRKGSHMRMTALLGRVGPQTRAALDRFAQAAPIAFLLLVLPGAITYAHEEAAVTTPALQISNVWRAAALPVGLVLMLGVGTLRALRGREPGRILGLAVAIAALVLVAGAVGPPLEALGNLNLFLFFVVILAGLVFAAVPIAFAFGLSSLGYIALATPVPVEVIAGRMEEGMSPLILLAVPLFVFLGLLIEMTGMARAMVAFMASLLGHVRGGLSYVLIGAMYLVSGISGSKAADMAAVAPALFPAMRERGADEGDLVALLSATGAQTETIPPSLVLLTIGSVTGVSIAALFTGGLLPALVVGACLCFVVWRRARGPGAAAPFKRASGSEIGRAFLLALPALALPFVIRACVVEGVATATEVSTIGIVYSGLVGLVVYRQFDWRRLHPMLVETAGLSGAILLIIGAATAMSWGLTQSGFSAALAAFMAGLPGGAPVFLAVTVLFFVVLGSVLEGIPAIVLFGPLLFSVAKQLGIHEVHYAMVVVLAMGIGLFAPPFGVGYYAACAIGRVDPDAGIKPIGGYLLALLVGTALVAAIPWISTGLLH
ncbi:TRAP transporter large permease subunit [Methylobacterium sp. Leaf456]|uniref:TRAP transporter large permease n=1 Tax=Methylobacterium sp. Leaf456 TaxID=1736382 RepID=UPI000AA2BEB4|nr:TRAP transporter large permease subunit [Methylobacterium sp. Leaf456]